MSLQIRAHSTPYWKTLFNFGEKVFNGSHTTLNNCKALLSVYIWGLFPRALDSSPPHPTPSSPPHAIPSNSLSLNIIRVLLLLLWFSNVMGFSLFVPLFFFYFRCCCLFFHSGAKCLWLRAKAGCSESGVLRENGMENMPEFLCYKSLERLSSCPGFRNPVS